MAFYTPLRYPGGKVKLLCFINEILDGNNMSVDHYVEPYAGGAGLAMALLMLKKVQLIYLNDIDRSIYSFWYSVLNNTELLCKKIYDTKVTIDEWHKQKDVQIHADEVSFLDLGFSTFYLNRTNRSGILNGGVIGGNKQDGGWKIDARFNKEELIRRICVIADNSHRIHLHNRDAIEFLELIEPHLTKDSLLYLDPPYYCKGKKLYTNFYTPQNHTDVAKYIQKIGHKWIVSYDNVEPIRKLYKVNSSFSYDLNYSAASKYKGSEVMFLSNDLLLPAIILSKKFKCIYNLITLC